MKLIVIGGGPAGVMAALRGRELGAEVTLLERNRLGGIGINDGVAPLRTLARTARLIRDWGAWATFGLHGPKPALDFPAALANARRVACYAHEQKSMEKFVRDRGVEVIDCAGPARFVDDRTVLLPDVRMFRADRFVIAVGGRARILPIPGHELGLTHADLWTLKELPARVTVVGAAATGCQMASIFRDFGAEVDLIEAAPRINGQADVDVSAALSTAFQERGIQVLTGCATERIEATSFGFKVTYRSGGQTDSLFTGAVFFAVGWTGNIDSLELEAAGIATERGFVAVNEYLATNVPHIYAVGDVNGQSMLVPSAAHEGLIAAENAVLGPRRKYSRRIVSSGSFTDPEYASVGLTESQARAAHDCAVALIRYDILTRAVVDARTEGFCKLIADRESGLILGAHVVGEYSAEVIQVVAACMAGGMTVEQVSDLELAYPTFTEAIGLAAQRLIREMGRAAAATVWNSTDVRHVAVG
jgi:pyruvate/2-oxoglutarate dehydrogenase complex dihydrolipoamide dehydrogenase (E3) component